MVQVPLWEFESKEREINSIIEIIRISKNSRGMDKYPFETRIKAPSNRIVSKNPCRRDTFIIASVVLCFFRNTLIIVAIVEKNPIIAKNNVT